MVAVSIPCWLHHVRAGRRNRDVLICQTSPVSWLGLIIPGLLAGALARLFVPTGRRFGCLGTIALGIVGSLIGGTLASLLAGDGLDVSTAGFIGSVVGAMLLLLVLRRNDNRAAP